MHVPPPPQPPPLRPDKEIGCVLVALIAALFGFCWFAVWALANSGR